MKHSFFPPISNRCKTMVPRQVGVFACLGVFCQNRLRRDSIVTSQIGMLGRVPLPPGPRPSTLSPGLLGLSSAAPSESPKALQDGKGGRNHSYANPFHSLLDICSFRKLGGERRNPWRHYLEVSSNNHILDFVPSHFLSSCWVAEPQILLVRASECVC